MDGILALGLFLAAFATRLPFLTLVPPWWNSEIGEALDATDIALGHSLPLVLPSQPHLGPVAVYPLALVLRVVGLNPFTPRFFVATAGALGVVATFLLLRVMGERLAALLAAGLLATNSFHIFISSHIFWTNSLTPLLTALALTALIVSVESETIPRPLSRRAGLVLAFSLWGLALQSHPSVWSLVPGVGLGVLLQPRTRAYLRDAWTWLAPSAGLLAYSNLILFNLFTGLASVAVLRAKSYALPDAPSIWRDFPDRLRDASTELQRVVSSNLPAELALDPITLAIAIWFTLALLLSLKEGRGLLFWPTVSALLLIGLFNKAYNVGYAERYIIFLLPLVYAMMALSADELWQWLHATSWPRVWSTFASLVTMGSLALCVARPLPVLMSYYEQEVEMGRSNETYLLWNDLTNHYSGSGYTLLLDPQLNQYQVVLNGSTVGTTLEYVFRMNGVETQWATDAQLKLGRTGVVASKVVMNLERSGFEESQRNLAVCVAQDQSRHVVIIYPSANEDCSD